MCEKYDVPIYKVIIYIILDTPNDDCNIHIETTDVVTAGEAAAPSPRTNHAMPSRRH